MARGWTLRATFAGRVAARQTEGGPGLLRRFTGFPGVVRIGGYGGVGCGSTTPEELPDWISTVSARSRLATLVSLADSVLAMNAGVV